MSGPIQKRQKDDSGESISSSSSSSVSGSSNGSGSSSDSGSRSGSCYSRNRFSLKTRDELKCQSRVAAVSDDLSNPK